MLPEDPNNKPGEPEETSPDLPLPDYSTRRFEPLDLDPPPAPAEPGSSDYATRKLEPDQAATNDASTRRINADELFSALEPPTAPEEPPAPPAGPTQIIDEPGSTSEASVFTLPDAPTQFSTPPAPERPRSDVFTLPPTADAPPRGSFTLPPDPVPPVGSSMPPARKDNTWIWIAGIVGVVVLVLCCLCACLLFFLMAVASGSGMNF